MIADRLKKLRVERGLSQAELSKKAGVHSVTLCEWEKGHTDGIKVQSVLKLADALGVPPSDLLGVETKK